MYVEFVWDQKVETWLRCHRNAFAYFGGIPKRLVIDNLKAAIIKAIWNDPQIQASYQECALHYGFLISPCRVRTPQHKGKVEQGGVHYVCRNFLGGREPTSLVQANQDVRHWIQTTAGLRDHGTTHEAPLKRYETLERNSLKALPEQPYDLAVWKKVRIHRDCYVCFEKSFYSVPFRAYPGSVWVCGGSREVRIYDLKYGLLSTHERARQAGERKTHRDHIPAEKQYGLYQTHDSILEEAEKVGHCTVEVVTRLLEHPALDRLPTAGLLVRLAGKHSPERLENACKKALEYDDPSYKTIKGILQKKMECVETPILVELPPATTFAREKNELVGNLAEVAAWN